MSNIFSESTIDLSDRVLVVQVRTFAIDVVRQRDQLQPASEMVKEAKVIEGYILGEAQA